MPKPLRRARITPSRPIGRRTFIEPLETRRMLDAGGFPGNAHPPNLDLSAVAAQTIVLGETLNLNLLTVGAKIVDQDASGQPIGDPVHFQLDPDIGIDTPVGATITPTGLFTWTPTSDQLGHFDIIMIAIDSGTPPR